MGALQVVTALKPRQKRLGWTWRKALIPVLSVQSWRLWGIVLGFVTRLPRISSDCENTFSSMTTKEKLSKVTVSVGLRVWGVAQYTTPYVQRWTPGVSHLVMVTYWRKAPSLRHFYQWSLMTGSFYRTSEQKKIYVIMKSCYSISYIWIVYLTIFVFGLILSYSITPVPDIKNCRNNSRKSVPF